MRRFVLTALTLVALLSGCTLSRSAHYQVDTEWWGATYATIYRKPSYQLAVVHRAICANDARCTVGMLERFVEPPWWAGYFWNQARNKPQELAAAIDDVEQSQWRRCVMLYSVWSNGWSVTNDPARCREGDFVPVT